MSSFHFPPSPFAFPAASNEFIKDNEEQRIVIDRNKKIKADVNFIFGLLLNDLEFYEAECFIWAVFCLFLLLMAGGGAHW